MKTDLITLNILIYYQLCFLPFSVGEARDIEVKEEESLTFEDTDSKESYVDTSSASSTGKHVSTSASRVLTNSVTFSALQLALVNGPVKKEIIFFVFDTEMMYANIIKTANLFEKLLVYDRLPANLHRPPKPQLCR